MLVALLILAGVALGGMFIVWLTAATLVGPDEGDVDKWKRIPAGRDNHEEGFERDLEAPGMEEVPELTEPQVEPSVEALTDAVSNVVALNVPSKGTGGRGDDRPPGPPGAGKNIIPRWEIRFEASSIHAYARQLDYFKIELGAVGGGKPNIDYAYNLTKGRPDSKAGPRDERQATLYDVARRNVAAVRSPTSGKGRNRFDQSRPATVLSGESRA